MASLAKPIRLKDLGLAFLAICLALFGILFLGLFVARILDRRGISVPYWCSICLSTLCYYQLSWVSFVWQSITAYIKFIVRTTGMLQAVKHSRSGCKGYPEIQKVWSYSLGIRFWNLPRLFENADMREFFILKITQCVGFITLVILTCKIRSTYLISQQPTQFLPP